MPRASAARNAAHSAEALAATKRKMTLPSAVAACLSSECRPFRVLAVLLVAAGAGGGLVRRRPRRSARIPPRAAVLAPVLVRGGRRRRPRHLHRTMRNE